jgi:hypothetical protein
VLASAALAQAYTFPAPHHHGEAGR